MPSHSASACVLSRHSKTPKPWPPRFGRQSQGKDSKSYCSVSDSKWKRVLSFSPRQEPPYERQSTYHPSRGRVLPLCEEIFTLLKSMRMQAATRCRSYWLLKLKGFLQDSRVETSSTVHRNHLRGLGYSSGETAEGVDTGHLRHCLQTKSLPISNVNTGLA